MISKKFCGLICVLGVSLCFDVTNGFKQTDSCVCGTTRVLNRIVNGRQAKLHKHPWQAALYTKYHMFLCGGSVITDKHILTAGHCVHNMYTDGWYVILGMYDQIARDGIEYLTDRWFVHENYSDEEFAVNDIAIGVTVKKIVFNGKVMPICLNFRKDPVENLIALATGWGTLTWKGTRPQMLEIGRVTIFPDSKCRERMEKAYDPKVMICASSYPSDACSGDSGGPLILPLSQELMVQIGIVSFGMECGSPESAGVYTRISTFYDWIKNHTSDGTTCSYAPIENL